MSITGVFIIVFLVFAVSIYRLLGGQIRAGRLDLNRKSKFIWSVVISLILTGMIAGIAFLREGQEEQGLAQEATSVSLSELAKNPEYYDGKLVLTSGSYDPSTNSINYFGEKNYSVDLEGWNPDASMGESVTEI